METIKTPEQITRLNFNDLAFFLGITAIDAKFRILASFGLKPEEYEKYINQRSGNPKISVNDYVDKSKFETKIKSCSALDGRNNIDFHIETYNKGIPLDRLRAYSESSAFIKALKFTGKNTILNQILNKDQLLVLQKAWLLRNTYLVRRWSKKCIEFIEKNKWCVEFLATKIDFEHEFMKQKELLEEENKPIKEVEKNEA